MKRIISIFMLINLLNAVFYPYLLMAQTAEEIAQQQKTAAAAEPVKKIKALVRNAAVSRSAMDIKVLWNAEAYQDTAHIEIVREPAFPDGAKIIQSDLSSFIDTEVQDGQQYKYSVFAVDSKGNKILVKTLSSYFGAKSGTAFAGKKSRVEYDGFNLNFKGNEFKSHKNKKVTVRISPNKIEEETLIQASELFEVTLDDSEEPVTAVPAEISYNTINMPKGLTENDLKVFVRHNAQSPWETAKIISIDKTKKIVTAEIPHFSEIMAGFAGAPQASETRANVNTALPKISLPDPSGGKIQIAEPQPNISGTLSQNIPIVLPTGKNGMAPSLSLVYNSDQKNGLCGIGWALAAGDTISYIKKNGSYVYTASAGDLTLDSVQGAVSNFVLTNENSFSKYVLSSDTWKVIKDGYTNYYGENNCILTNNLPENISKQWLLTGKVNSDNTAVNYNYIRTEGNELLLDNITYNRVKIQMIRETRPDAFSYNSAFGYYTMKERLVSIQISNTLNSSGSWQLDRQYVLNYDTNDTGDSLLNKLELRYGPDSTVLSQVDMTYKTNSFVQAVSSSSTSWNTGNPEPIAEDRQRLMPMDINGDGLQDLLVVMDGITNTVTYGKFKIYTNNGKGFTAMQNLWHINDGNNVDDLPMERISFQDMNGDGLPDIVANYSAYNGTATGTWKVFTNSGSGFINAPDFTLTKDIDPSRFSLKDMNGDGKPDFVLNKTSFNGNVGVLLETYTNSGTNIVSTPVNWSYSTVIDPAVIGLKDVTGDGIPDLMIQSNTTVSNIWIVYANTGTNFRATAINYSIPKTDPQFIEWMDINGDGMRELAVNTNHILSVYRNNGTSLSNIAETWMTPTNEPYDMSFQDMNGDGRPDIVVNYQNTNIKMDVWLNNGAGFAFRGTIDLQGSEPSSLSYNDINGDGAADSVINNTDGSMTVYRGSPNYNYLLNTMEVNNLVFAYNYTNVNQGLGFAKTVLQGVLISNKLPSGDTGDPGSFKKSTAYTYENGKYDRQNRIMYGFGKITTADLNNTNQSVAYYSQSAPELIGRVLTNEIYAGYYTNLVSRSINNYMVMNANNNQSKIALLTNTVSVTISFDSNETNTQRTDYQYYGADDNSDLTAGKYFLLSKKIECRNVLNTGYSDTNTNDNVYQEYKYTAEGTGGNITPKLYSSESYMTNTQNQTRFKLAETQYYFAGVSGAKNLGNSALVSYKEEWSGTNSSGDMWLRTSNIYSASEPDRLSGIRVYTNGTGLIKQTDYGYDDTDRFVAATTNTMGPVVETSRSVLDPVWGMPLQSIDNNNQTTYYRYDKWNRIIAIYAPGDNFESYYPQTGNDDCSALINNANDTASSLYVYGTTGQLNYTKALKRLNRNETGSSPYIESIVFLDGFGRTLQTKISHQKADGNKTYVISGKNRYNGSGQIIESNDPVNIDGSAETLETYHSYAAGSQNNPVTTGYDGLGRVVLVSKGSGTATISSSMNYIGLYTTVSIDGATNVQETIKNEYGQVKRIIDYTNHARQPGNIYSTIDYAYDERGNLLKTTDSSNNMIQMDYDYLNRKTAMHDPDMGNWSYQYDDLGSLTETIDGNSNSTYCLYDDAGRLTNKYYSGANTPSVSYYYGDDPSQNNNGRLIQVIDGAGDVSYAYNERGEMIETRNFIDNKTYISSSEFDALGRVKEMTYPHLASENSADIIKLSYAYQKYSGLLDQINRIDTADDSIVLTNYLSNITYDNLGRRTKMTYGNGVATTYNYDSVKSMLASCAVSNGQIGLRDMVYSFDNVGNLLRKVETEFITYYDYDDLYRLKKTRFGPIMTGLYGYTKENTYDALGNITSKDVDTLSLSPGNRNYAYTNGRPHAVASFDGIYGGDKNAHYSMDYDANGNMTQESIAYKINGVDAAPAVKSFTWNAENQLTALSWNGDTWNYVYDASGERIKKIKTTGQTADTTVYVNGIAQFKPETESSVYSICDGVNRIASVSKVAGINSLYYIHTDHVGSATMITTAMGTIYERVVYNSFGEIYQAWNTSGWSAPNPDTLAFIGNYAFTGQELDSETGLYYYGARYYDPNIGRFISADSVIDGKGVDTQGYNRYTYARNNPVTYSDPSGHDWWNDFWNSDNGKFTTRVLGGILAVASIFVLPFNPVLGLAMMYVGLNMGSNGKINELLKPVLDINLSENNGVINFDFNLCSGLFSTGVTLDFNDGLYVSGYQDVGYGLYHQDSYLSITSKEVGFGINSDILGLTLETFDTGVYWDKDGHMQGFYEVGVSPFFSAYADTEGNSQYVAFLYAWNSGKFGEDDGLLFAKAYGKSCGLDRKIDDVDDPSKIDPVDRLGYYHDRETAYGLSSYVDSTYKRTAEARNMLRHGNDYSPAQRHGLRDFKMLYATAVLTDLAIGARKLLYPAEYAGIVK